MLKNNLFSTFIFFYFLNLIKYTITPNKRIVKAAIPNITNVFWFDSVLSSLVTVFSFLLYETTYFPKRLDLIKIFPLAFSYSTDSNSPSITS